MFLYVQCGLLDDCDLRKGVLDTLFRVIHAHIGRSEEERSLSVVILSHLMKLVEVCVCVCVRERMCVKGFVRVGVSVCVCMFCGEDGSAVCVVGVCKCVLWVYVGGAICMCWYVCVKMVCV